VSPHRIDAIRAIAERSTASYSLENWQAAVDNSIKQGVKFDKLEKPEDFVAKAPVLNGPLKGWRGVYNAKAGWTHALNAMKAVYADCLRLGIRFVTGPSGTMGNLIQGEDGEVLGVEAEDGTRHLADRVILACGGWMDSVIDTKGQCLAKAWCLVHIQLTEEEAAKWKGMPVINNRMLGYMFEPDAEGRQLKIAPHSVGYTHYVSPGKSFPRAKSSYPSDGIPTEAKEGIRELLRDTLPDLADRPFGYERMCWDADSKDAHFLITDHPEHRNMYIAGGASAHGFKFFPIIGNHIMQLLEGRLEPELKEAWQWRPWQQIKQDTSRPDLPNVDLRDVEGWNNERVARL